MCTYIIITLVSLIWFICTLFTSMLLTMATITPKWLIGPDEFTEIQYNRTIIRSPSVGIYSRCQQSTSKKYDCSYFDMDGFGTESDIYPTPWKSAELFMTLATTIMVLAVGCCLITFCRQSVMGKGIHGIAGSAQAFAGICVMIGIFCHMLGWGVDRVHRLCGPDSAPFYVGECYIGSSMYCAITGVFLCFVCGFLSHMSESASRSYHVKRRIESGERIVCIA